MAALAHQRRERDGAKTGGAMSQEITAGQQGQETAAVHEYEVGIKGYEGKWPTIGGDAAPGMSANFQGAISFPSLPSLGAMPRLSC